MGSDEHCKPGEILVWAPASSHFRGAEERLRKRAMNTENKEVLRRQREANETIAKERAAAQKSIEAIAAALGRELTTRTIAGVNELFGKALDRYGKVVRVFILQKSFYKIKSLSLRSDIHVRV